MIENAVYTPDKKVVIQWYQPVPKYIRIGDTEIVFDCQHAVSLAFVSENVVQSLLDYRGGCCGNKQQVMYLASPASYSHWKDGNGGR